MLIDSHCHLNMPTFEGRIDAVLSDARAGGVEGFLTISTMLEECQQVIDIAAPQPDVYATVGVHPHEARRTLDTHGLDGLVSALERHLHHPKVVAIGEIGLDYHYLHSDKAAQQDVFHAQLCLAADRDLPVIIHSRDADDDTLDALKPFAGRVLGVIHCFTGTQKLADGALELGFYLSVSGVVTFKKATEIQGIFRNVDLSRLLIETDAPYLAPVPHRGQVNEPKFVRHTAQFLADLHGVSLETVAHHTTHNFYTLFSKAQRP